MSENIHGFGDDYSNDNNRNDDYRYSPDDPTPIYAKMQYRGDPKNQSIPNFLKLSICPFFSFKSFSFIIIVINLVIFIVSLFPHGLNQFQLDIYFLPPSYETLRVMGDLSGPDIRKYPWQAYRWITGNLLHAYYTHILYNCFSILIIGTMLEYLIGTWRYTVIYILSGILGSLFSVLVDFRSRSVGASICICGIIAANIGFYIINWNALTRIFGIQNKCCILMFPIMVAIMCFPIFYSSGQSGIDTESNINTYGHLGGFIFGFFLSFIFIKPQDESDTCFFNYKICFYLGIVVCSVFAVAGFLCFYLLDKYKP